MTKVRGPHWAADFEDCEKFGAAIEDFLKTANPKTRKSIEQIIGPLMLFNTGAVVFGPALAYEFDQMKEKGKRRHEQVSGTIQQEQAGQTDAGFTPAFPKGGGTASSSKGLAEHYGQGGPGTITDSPVLDALDQENYQ